jgi:hypothetical protein
MALFLQSFSILLLSAVQAMSIFYLYLIPNFEFLRLALSSALPSSFGDV